MLHKILVYAAFGFLLFGGVMHFAVDVLSQHFRRKRVPGAETTLYYGLHTAFAFGQIGFALMSLLAFHQGARFVGAWPGLALGLAAASGWLSISILFIAYREPRHIMAVFIALLIGALATA